MSGHLRHPGTPITTGCRRATAMAGRAFTLSELLVAMAIIALLTTVTVVAVQAIARDSRLSSAMNSVVVALDNGRALAMKENALIMVVFRARWEEEQNREYTEIVIAKWTGETQPVELDGDPHPDLLVDRFLPLPTVPARRLPVGIKVAAPFYDVENDLVWVTQPEFRFTSTTPPQEVGGRTIGIMFGPDGTVLTDNPSNPGTPFMPFQPGGQTDWVAFIDFDNDRIQDIGSTTGADSFWVTDEPDDESNIEPAAFLAVYDDRAARENKALDWSTLGDYIAELTGPDGYISRNADRIHFNKYSGVALR